MKQVTKYEAEDGRLFDTAIEAELHEQTDVFRKKIEHFLEKWEFSGPIIKTAVYNTIISNPEDIYNILHQTKKLWKKNKVSK